MCFEEENLRDDLFKFPAKSTIENNSIFNQVRTSEKVQMIKRDTIRFNLI